MMGRRAFMNIRGLTENHDEILNLRDSSTDALYSGFSLCCLSDISDVLTDLPASFFVVFLSFSEESLLSLEFG
jgi:hypothetical protein